MRNRAVSALPTCGSMLLGGLAVALAGAGCPITCPLPESEVADAPEDFDAAVNELQMTLEPNDNSFFAEDVVAGTCGDQGPLFTFRFTGPFTWQYDYFDASSRVFVGRSIGMADVPVFFLVCTERYWPQLIPCRDPVVTDVIRGTRYQVGDEGVLP